MTSHYSIMDPARRAELRMKRKRLRSNSLPHLTLEDEKKLMQQIQNKISFYSLSLRKINPETVASTFIVRTHKPIRWRDFIILVGTALEEVL